MHYSRAYLRLLSVNRRYRYIYTLVAGLIFIAAWIFLWYLPLEKRIQQYDLEIKQSKKDGDQYAEQQILCKKLTGEAEQLQHDVSVLHDAALNVSAYISRLMQYTQDAGLHLVSLRSTDHKDHGWYITDRVAYDASGSLASTVQFFTLLAKQQMCVQCDDMSLLRQADDTFLLHCILRRISLKSAQVPERKSPSTLR